MLGEDTNIHAIHTDCHDLARAIDINGMNHYPTRTPELAIDFYRGAKKEVWCLEQHTRLQNMDTPAGRMRLWAWMAIAHGASGIVHFRWRQCRWGTEQFADGILPHSGQENRFYHDLARTGSEIKILGDMIDRTKPCAEVAIVMSYESRWSIQSSKFEKDVDPVPEAVDYHKALARRLTAIDAMDPRENLSAYKLVIAPRLWVVDGKIAANLQDFVKNGGILCLTAGSGVVDEYSKSFDTPRPGPLSEIAGVTVSDIAFDKNMHIQLASNVIPGIDGAEGYMLADELHLNGADVLASHTTGWRNGQPAITSHIFGSGRVIYVGIRLDSKGISALVNWLCDSAGLPQEFTLPPDVSAYERVCDEYRLLFLINWSNEIQSVHVGGQWSDAFSAEEVSDVKIHANDIRILRSK